MGKALALLVLPALVVAAQRTRPEPLGRAVSDRPVEVSVADFDRDVRAFLDREMGAHLSDIRLLNPPQERVVGALMTGEYTWGTSMRSLAGKPGERVDPAIDSSVEWRLERGALVRTERLSVQRPVTIRRWRLVLPATGSRWTTSSENGRRTDIFEAVDGRPAVSLLKVDWPIAIAVRATATAPTTAARAVRFPCTSNSTRAMSQFSLQPH